MIKLSWTEEKEEELKQMWNNYALYKIATHFHTTEDTIKNKANELHLPEYKSNRWTKEEEQLLIEYAPKYVTKTIAKKLGRSYLAVQKKALKLGVELHSEKDPWKKWMVDYLKDNINKKAIGEIENMIGLSYHRIITKCRELNIKYESERWSEDEIKILKEYAQKCHYTELTKVLPNRSVGAISAKAYELGIETISEYTTLADKEIEFIKENWGMIPATEIARQLKISTGILYRYKKILNLPNVGQQKKWTKEIIEKIREDAKTKTRNELAKKYNTSSAQISRIAYQNKFALIDSKKIWTEKLDNELKELVDKKLNINEIAAEMKMPASSIRQRLKFLDIKELSPKNPNYRIWTEEEVMQLCLFSKEKTSSELALLCNKTEKQVCNKARKLGIELNRDIAYLWTQEETDYLIKLCDKYEMHIIAKVMDRSEATIRSKAKELRLKLKYKPRKYWTKVEEEKLKKYAEEYTIKEIAHLLDRSEASISGKLKYMGIIAQRSPKFWMQSELDELIFLSKNYDINEIAQKMNKSYEAIYAKAYDLGLKLKNNSNREWTEEEIKTLIELLTTYSTFEVAEILNRSEEAVKVRAIKSGYFIDSRQRRWTEEEEIMLSDLWGSEPIEKIAKKLNRTASAISNRVCMLGLGSQISNNYEGISIQEIADLFFVNREVILTSWVSLGLKLDFKKRSKNSTYAYVQISNLYDFLEKNKNIWDSRILDKNSLGTEPEWLKEKRGEDKNKPMNHFKLDNLNKQQLIQAKKYVLELENINKEIQVEEDLFIKKMIKIKANEINNKNNENL